MIQRTVSLLLGMLMLVATAAFAQHPANPMPPAPTVTVKSSGPPAGRMFGEKGTVGFERTRVNFMPQSINIENAVNVPITNSTDHPSLLTKLVSLDPTHFYVSSPASGMLPLKVGTNTTLFINLCFKPTEVHTYSSTLLAIFGNDTSYLRLDGKGIKPPVPQPIPKESSIISVKRGKHDWTINLGLSVHGSMRLILEDVMGNTLRNFRFDDIKSPGIYQATFDGTNDVGKKIPHGTYYLRMEVVNHQNNTVIHDSKTFVLR